MRLLLVSLGIGLGFVCGALAQPAAPRPTPPAGPLIAKRAPDFSEWVLTTTVKSLGTSLTSADGSAASLARADSKSKTNVQTVKVSKTGDVRHVATSTSDGSKSDVWCRAALQVTVRPEWKEPLISTGENRWDGARIDFSESDFAGFGWISAANFVGVRKVSGRDCLVFQDKILPFTVDPKDRPVNADGSPAAPIDYEKLKVPAVACTDLDTRLPVALQVGDAVTLYTFGDPPAAMLTLPPEVQKAVTAADQKRQNMLRKPARP